MKTRVLRVIRVIFKPGRFKLIKVLSKLSHTILKLKFQIKKSMKNLGNKHTNHLQEETEEVSRRIAEPTITPRPKQPPSPIRVREIEEPTVNPQPTQAPNPIQLRRKTEPTITPRPSRPPTPVRLRKITVGTISPRPKKSPRPAR